MNEPTITEKTQITNEMITAVRNEHLRKLLRKMQSLKNKTGKPFKQAQKEYDRFLQEKEPSKKLTEEELEDLPTLFPEFKWELKKK